MDLKDKLISSYASLSEHNGSNDKLTNMRREAIKNFENKGFPTKKEEAWKYTSLRPIIKEDYSLFPKSETNLKKEDIEAYTIDGLDAHLLVFVDGRFAEHLSKTTEDQIDAVEISAARNHEKYSALIDRYFNHIAPNEDSLNSLNTAFSQEGTLIHVKNNVTADKPVQLLYLSTGSEKAMMLQPRNLVVVEENAQATIIERHQSLAENPVLTNTVTEISVGQYAMVDYYKIQNDKRSASLIDNTFIAQGRDSHFTCHTFSFGGKLTRNTVKVFQQGEHVNSTLKGVTILEDKQHVDHNTLVHHQQPNSESHQDYKGVFDDRSVGVFDGYILVDKIAQQTDGYQSSNNLLLSDKAKVNTKPQLEIYADDVVCSHGCTVGQLDKEDLFYLKSRGIPEKEAKALLMYAFSNTVLTSVKIPELQRQVNKQIADKLGVDLGFDE